MSQRSGAVQVAAILLFGLTLALLTWRADQPIVENYVGRQVPTAMVARNLERGSGLLRPQLDTGPFPNLFLVEPPLYASAVVGFRHLFGTELSVAGRWTSALCMTLGAWGLFGLVRKREGATVALLAVAAFALLPLTLRYGRAFQPDAAMLGTQLAALRLWDASLSSPCNGANKARLAVAWILLAASLALKVTSAFILIPIGLMIWTRCLGSDSWKRLAIVLLSFSALLPAMCWYVYAAYLIQEGQGSQASADNSRIWLSVFWPTALLDGRTYTTAAWMLLVRAFTPLGVLLAVWGLTRPGTDRLWQAWAGAASLALLGLAAKLHHEYYGMVLTPLVALGIARSLSSLARQGGAGRTWAAVLGSGLLALSITQAADTWRTPADWRALPEAVSEIQRLVPPGEAIVAPEALLFSSDRRGARLEPPGPSAARAAGEWGETLDDPEDPLALVELYRQKGIGYFADLSPDPEETARLAQHAAVLRNYQILTDRPGVLIARLIIRSNVDTTRQAPPRFLKKEAVPMAKTESTEPPASSPSPVTPPGLIRMKAEGHKIVSLTAYDYTMARLLDEAGVDVLLVGDSLGTVLQGHATTLRVTLDQMVYHAEMVARASRRALVVADLPFGSYGASTEQAVRSASRFLKETDCQAVKLEGGRRTAATIRALVDADLPVMAHIGLTPQSVRHLGGFKVQRDAKAILDDAQAVAEAGAFAVVLECIPAEVAAQVTEELSIPTIGIGAGPNCDGQVLVTPDMLGLFEGFRPRFVRRYVDLSGSIRTAAQQFSADVRSGDFPNADESFQGPGRSS